jgi:uncharacterized protein
MSPISRWCLWSGGCLALSLGVVGVFLPLVPTTPFLLLASYCFVRVSPRAHRWLLTHRWFGPYLQDWEQYRGVRRSVKWLATATVLTVVGLGLSSGRLSPAAMTAMVCLGSCGLLVVYRLPVVEDQLERAQISSLPQPAVAHESSDLAA